MKTIYRVGDLDVEGRYPSNFRFFESKEDAQKEAGFQNGKPSEYKDYSEFLLYGPGEYNPENIKKQKALAKLTPEEKTLLGLD